MEIDEHEYPNVGKLFNSVMNEYGGFRQFKGSRWAIESNYKDGEFYLRRDPYSKGGWHWEDCNGDIVEYTHPDNSRSQAKLQDLLNRDRELKDNLQESELSDKEDKYYKYLELHISSVNNIFNYLCKLAHAWEKDNSLDDNQNNPFTWILANESELQEQLLHHDESKFEDEEFEDYRKHFYPIDDQEGMNTEGFKLACLHHVNNNPHHWEFWCECQPDGTYILNDDIDEHDYLLSIIERCCDEASMSQLYDNRVLDWYEQNKDKIIQPEFANDFYLQLLKIIQDNNLDVNEENKKKFDSFKEKLDESSILKEWGEESIDDINRLKKISFINNIYPHMSLEGKGDKAIDSIYKSAKKLDLQNLINSYYKTEEKASRPKYVKSNGTTYIAADDPAKGYNALNDSEVTRITKFNSIQQLYDYSGGHIYQLNSYRPDIKLTHSDDGQAMILLNKNTGEITKGLHNINREFQNSELSIER